jgi:hypothetical protein
LTTEIDLTSTVRSLRLAGNRLQDQAVTISEVRAGLIPASMKDYNFHRVEKGGERGDKERERVEVDSPSAVRSPSKGVN